MNPHPIDAEFVVYRLEEAGHTMLSLPGSAWPAGMRTAWPAILQATAEAYGYTPEQGALGSDEREWRPPVPSASKIDRMDEALRWVIHIPRLEGSPHGGALLARIVLMRSLVSPRTERHWWSWNKIGNALGCHRDSVKTWHGQGIGWIVLALNGGTSKKPITAGRRSRPNYDVSIMT